MRRILLSLCAVLIASGPVLSLAPRAQADDEVRFTLRDSRATAGVATGEFRARSDRLEVEVEGAPRNASVFLAICVQAHCPSPERDFNFKTDGDGKGELRLEPNPLGRTVTTGAEVAVATSSPIAAIVCNQNAINDYPGSCPV